MRIVVQKLGITQLSMKPILVTNSLSLQTLGLDSV